MNKSTLKFTSKLAIIVLCLLGLLELALALWTVCDRRYRSLAYELANVGYIDLWVLRYVSLCLFASSVFTLVMALVLIWGLCATHALIFIAATMIAFIVIGEFTISVVTFSSKYQMRLTLMEQLPKLVITYRQGTDERARRAFDELHYTFRCCGSDGRLSFQNNVPLSCNMFSIGCLTRTIYFLDACMDVIAYILLFFSLIKLIIVLFFYSFLYVNHRYRQNRLNNNNNDPSEYRHSSSFNSSSSDNSPKRIHIKPLTANQVQNDDEYSAEQQHVISNEYEERPPLPTKRIHYYTTDIISPSSFDNNNNKPIVYYDPQPATRKLSSISEKTEKTETDDSEPDVSRLKYIKSKRKTIITPVHPLPIIKTRRTIVREEDHDSGVERSSSEKSFDDHLVQKSHTDIIDIPPKSNNKSSSALTFSNVFITSVSDPQTINDEVKKPLITSSSSSDPLHSTKITTPKPILKKTNQQHQKKRSPVLTKTPPLLHNIPLPNPRTSLKQLK